MLYVLDIDDTLILERDYVYSGFSAVDRWLRKNCELTGFFEEAWHLFESGRRKKIFDTVLNELDFNEYGMIENLVRVYREHKPQIKLLPDAERFLARQKRQNLGIITDGYSSTQWAKVESLDLKSKVDKIIITDDWGIDFWKPNSRSFMTIQKSLPSEQCVYVADNPLKDFKAPEALGWSPSIRIRREGSLNYNLSTPDSCAEIATFDEIV